MKDSNQSITDKVTPLIKKNPVVYKLARSIHRKYITKSHEGVRRHFPSLPDFLIIGADKAGTSSLYNYLNQHPQILPCITKEPRYFSEFYDKGIKWYKSCFTHSYLEYFKKNILKKKFRTGEASANYYWHPHVAKRVHDTIPNAKIIFLLRNPIDRAYSDYHMRLRFSIFGKDRIVSQPARFDELKFQDKGVLNGISFEDVIKMEDEKIKGEIEKMVNDKTYFSSIFFDKACLVKGIYINFIKNWRKFFPKNQLLIIQSEKLFENAIDTTNQVSKFLGLSPLSKLNFSILEQGSYVKMKSDTRKKLIDYFKPYNKELYDYLGTDFGWDK